jgi:hypothetical protein
VEFPARLRPRRVDPTQLRFTVERHAGPVAPLVHAAHPVAFDDQVLRHDIPGPQLDHQMTTTPATGAQGKIIVGRNAPDHDSPPAIGEPYSALGRRPQPTRARRV